MAVHISSFGLFELIYFTLIYLSCSSLSHFFCLFILLSMFSKDPKTFFEISKKKKRYKQSYFSKQLIMLNYSNILKKLCKRSFKLLVPLDISFSKPDR